jgi:hypothetical protein
MLQKMFNLNNFFYQRFRLLTQLLDYKQITPPPPYKLVFSRICIAFVAIMLVTSHIEAQVTIGADKGPAAGSLLSLNVETMGGLQLSNVHLDYLVEIPDSFPGMSGLEDSDLADAKEAFKGALVYNINPLIGQGEGIYAWNGEKWDYVGEDSEVPLPISMGGTGAIDKTNALKNLLPDFAGNDGKVLGLNDGNPDWIYPQSGYKGARFVRAVGKYTASISANSNYTVPLTYKDGDNTMLSGDYFVAPVDGIYITTVPQYSINSSSAYTNSHINHYTSDNVAINMYVVGTSLGGGNRGTAFSITLKMNAGEKVAWRFWTNSNITLLPIWTGSDPPITFTLIEQSVTDYTLNEQPTGERWIDGKPVYRKTFQGNATAAANAEHIITLIPANTVDTIVDSGGSMQPGWANVYETVNANYTFGAGTFSSIIGQENDQSVSLYSKSTGDRSISNNYYNVWVEYTKQ